MSELLPVTPADLQSVVITLPDPTPDAARKLVQRARQRFALNIADLDWDVEGRKEDGVVTDNTVHLLERVGFEVADLPPKMREQHAKNTAAAYAAQLAYAARRRWTDAMEAHVVGGNPLSDDDKLDAVSMSKGGSWYNVIRVDWDRLDGILERMGQLGVRLSNLNLVTRPFDRATLPSPSWRHTRLNGAYHSIIRKMLAEGGMSDRLHAACLKWNERADALDKQHREYFDWANGQVEFLSQGLDQRVEVCGYEDVDGGRTPDEDRPSE